MNEKVLNLSLNVETVNLILEALANLPYRQSVGVIQAIQKQASEQMQSAQSEIVEE